MALRHDNIRPSAQEVGRGTRRGDLWRLRNGARYRQLSAVGAGRCAEHDIQCIHRGIKPRPEYRHRGLNLSQHPFGLTHLIAGRQSFVVKEADLFQQCLLCADLFLRDGQAGL